jgi:predicted DCC family thiol-disulfide oxidoreductase YuxK
MREPGVRTRKVYFNGACPVCNAGVAHQRKKMENADGGCHIEWSDISDNPHALVNRGVSVDDVRRKLYVEDYQGRLAVGAAAFAALWSETPGQKMLGRLLTMPVIAVVGRWLYDGFAAVLYAWNRYKKRW